MTAVIDVAPRAPYVGLGVTAAAGGARAHSDPPTPPNEPPPAPPQAPPPGPDLPPAPIDDPLPPGHPEPVHEPPVTPTPMA
ncbi:hypothetical protein [Caldimonas brevitalea]|uniref:Uncharacterized protein n=1 Tax=Caldimonas brevitalea TaxID=413882 RepID=A0A0G3BWQ1_9BURK|nr:hypothetical protein [Caldimonas brevitalea]AKJ31786.1 hypothetical protein AAW51_5095 [Caldimonas brevitalea]